MAIRGVKPGGPKRGGRKKGVPNKVTRELREAAAATGILPAQLMLRNMRFFDNAAQAEIRRETRKPLKERDFGKVYDLMGRAHACALDCAPYYHPRLAAIAGARPPDPTATRLEDLITMSFGTPPANQNAPALPAPDADAGGSLADAVTAAE